LTVLEICFYRRTPSSSAAFDEIFARVLVYAQTFSPRLQVVKKTTFARAFE
jgi:hypothetical protein